MLFLLPLAGLDQDQSILLCFHGAGFCSPRAHLDDTVEVRNEPREMAERFISIVITKLVTCRSALGLVQTNYNDTK